MAAPGSCVFARARAPKQGHEWNLRSRRQIPAGGRHHTGVTSILLADARDAETVPTSRFPAPCEASPAAPARRERQREPEAAQQEDANRGQKTVVSGLLLLEWTAVTKGIKVVETGPLQDIKVAEMRLRKEEDATQAKLAEPVGLLRGDRGISTRASDSGRRTFRAIHNAAGHKLRPSPVNRFTPGDSGSRATEGGRGSEVKKRKARKGSGGEARTEREQASSKVVSGTGTLWALMAL
ncbi:hypothetical protein AK812_SmicGene21838 [Symbiodinium microadriaticum]|uniref:Uncharacterized protein n=1 Tax=Symbiodinium microadriaticum TaxID=2951 RepID=A0A1Q9DLC3_SYMMI|nr:hypothetical protein AK812_SmicGene21838 [Symbiodinium microadriaticum]